MQVTWIRYTSSSKDSEPSWPLPKLPWQPRKDTSSHQPHLQVPIICITAYVSRSMNRLLGGTFEATGASRPPRHSESSSPKFVYQMSSVSGGVPVLFPTSHQQDERNTSASALSTQSLASPRQMSLARLAESARDLLANTSDPNSTPRGAIQQLVLIEGKSPRSMVMPEQARILEYPSAKTFPIAPLFSSPLVQLEAGATKLIRLEAGHVVAALIACGVTGRFHDVWSSTSSQVFNAALSPY